MLILCNNITNVLQYYVLNKQSDQIKKIFPIYSRTLTISIYTFKSAVCLVFLDLFFHFYDNTAASVHC